MKKEGRSNLMRELRRYCLKMLYLNLFIYLNTPSFQFITAFYNRIYAPMLKMFSEVAKTMATIKGLQDKVKLGRSNIEDKLNS